MEGQDLTVQPIFTEDEAAPVDEIDWVEQVEQRQDEAQRYRSGGLDSSFMSLEAEWEQNGHRYLGNHWVAPSVGSGLVEGYKVYHFADSGGGMKGLKRCTLNRTGTSIIGNTAGQTQQQVTTRFEPVESADPPTHYLTAAGCEDVLATFTAQLAAIESQNVAMAVDAERTPEAGVDPAQVEALGQQQLAQVQSSFGFDFAMLEQAAADPAGALPITRKQAKAVQAMIDAGQVERDDLMIVNDAFTAEVAQIAYDDRWAVADGDMKVVMNTLMCNVYGNYPMRIQWHRDGPRKHQFTLAAIASAVSITNRIAASASGCVSCSVFRYSARASTREMPLALASPDMMT